MAGPAGNYQPGTVISVSDAEGKQLAAGGYAEILDTPHVVEAAEPPAPQVPAKPKPAAKKAVK